MPLHWVHEHHFPDSPTLVHALSGEIKVDLEEAIGERGACSLVVSGGRTPRALFEQLRTEALDWTKVWIALADERWVETTSPDSNEYLVRETLLQDLAAAAHFIGLKNPAPKPEAGAEWASRALTRVPRPFDVVVLGMGEDGHTASLFPGSLALARGLDPAAVPGCIAVNALTAPHARLSLNLSALLDSRRIILYIEGEAKRHVYLRARVPGTVAEYPVRAILHQRTVPVDVFWAP
ncbi:6-phosphogluconolactonase [Steroidobacter denitrificans]|uniref:6-phosphogluconolactonase n=1 Tax=Steroidobacter denitrificans TaxID=465721 RepID=A0A127F7V9_STEDE|nr:6-phosphogluconolactonase [Steroidobacter denitrificans]AMN45685.1 6-phosphogluconolactonase [Steroidobacter denitrificans]